MRLEELNYEGAIDRLSSLNGNDYRIKINEISRLFDKKRFTRYNGYMVIPDVLLEDIKTRVLSALQYNDAHILRHTVYEIIDYSWIKERCIKVTTNPSYKQTCSKYGETDKYYIDYSQEEHIDRCFKEVRVLILKALFEVG